MFVDYTDPTWEEQLENTLLEQSRYAPEFLGGSWLLTFEKAREIIGQFGEEVTDVILCGCGDSHHAAAGLEFAFQNLAQRNSQGLSSMSSSRYRIPQITRPEGTMVVGISASGEVARTLEALELAREAKAITVALTSDGSSRLARAATASISIPTPSFPGPGLISYLASLMMGFALCGALAAEEEVNQIAALFDALPDRLEGWVEGQTRVGREVAELMGGRESIVFLGGGPLYASAMFSAAKVIESAGTHAWAQDVEEWAHLEYFCEPAGMLTWLLSAEGRCASREREVQSAAEAIGRRMLASRWPGERELSAVYREAFSPLFLWAAPCAFAATYARLLGETPFRGFGGGRSREEGGGPSRIRSSERAASLKETVLPRARRLSTLTGLSEELEGKADKGSENVVDRGA
jgi:glucosamine--fructose-6-phosphate aminotransferase (isomerizing)